MKGYTILHSIHLLEDQVEDLENSAGGGTAADITYDNTSSGLTADDVQDAIDELNTGLSSANANITDILARLFQFSTTELLVGKFAGLDLYVKLRQVPSALTLGTAGSWVNSGVSFGSDETPVFYYLIASYGYGAIATNVGSSKEINFANVQKIGNITIPADSYIITFYTKTPAETNTRSKKSKKEE